MLQKAEKVQVLSLIGVLSVLSFCKVPFASVGIYCGAYWWHHLIYQFFHASWLHAAINCYCLYCILSRTGLTLTAVLYAYLISCFTPAISYTPVVGFSGVVFALIGMNCHFVARKVFYTLYIFAFIIISSFFATSWFTHSFCYVAGFLFISLLGLIHRVRSRYHKGE